jgi:hypothetical protein
MNYCLDCVIKHLADAKINHEEALNGYPDHALDVIGNLSQAANECIGASKELAEEIRQHRLMFMENINYPVPYYFLYNRVLGMIKDNGCGDCKKAKENFKAKIKEIRNEQK